MPYSRAQARMAARSRHWPDLRYHPETGEAKLFYTAEEVPYGWVLKRPTHCLPKEGIVLNRDELLAKLTEMNIEPDHTWGTAHMKRIIDGDVSPSR